jgi:hypothetical protein
VTGREIELAINGIDRSEGCKNPMWGINTARLLNVAE